MPNPKDDHALIFNAFNAEDYAMVSHPQSSVVASTERSHLPSKGIRVFRVLLNLGDDPLSVRWGEAANILQGLD